MSIIFCVAVGGFLGSALGGAVFTYKYLAQLKAERREMGHGRESLSSMFLSMIPRKALPLLPRRPGNKSAISQDASPPETIIPTDDSVEKSETKRIQHLEKK